MHARTGNGIFIQGFIYYLFFIHHNNLHKSLPSVSPALAVWASDAAVRSSRGAYEERNGVLYSVVRVRRRLLVRQRNTLCERYNQVNVY